MLSDTVGVKFVIKLLIALILFVLFFWQLTKRIKKILNMKRRLELRQRTSVFAAETVHHSEAEFTDETLFKPFPRWIVLIAATILFLFFVFILWMKF